MKKHASAIHLRKMFSCPVAGCKVTSGWKETICKHVRAFHTKEKPFACSVTGCQFTSGWRASVKAHMQAAHASEKPYACSVAQCSYRSAYHANLSRNRQSAHKGRSLPYPSVDSLPRVLKTKRSSRPPRVTASVTSSRLSISTCASSPLVMTEMIRVPFDASI